MQRLIAEIRYIIVVRNNSLYVGPLYWPYSNIEQLALRSQASRVLIQLAWYTQVLFSGCTVNFR